MICFISIYIYHLKREGQDLEVLEGDRVELSCEVTPSLNPSVLGGE